MSIASWNGKLINQDQVMISPDNRSFRYGDGCFETIKVLHGNIILPELHFNRLFASLELLQLTKPTFFTKQYFQDQIIQVIKANNHTASSRVRLTMFRDEIRLEQNAHFEPKFIIQSWEAKEELSFYNEQGFSIDFYLDAKKSYDRFSGIKSNNYLPYLMGAIWAKQQGLDDAIITNSHGSISDSTIANVFIISDGLVKTPSLNEGCVDGTMRKYLLACFKREGIAFVETALTIEDMTTASEVFLTNAMYGIRWVKSFQKTNYTNQTSSFFYEKFLTPLFKP